jgi:Ca2+-binding RTX toxin-like protein
MLRIDGRVHIDETWTGTENNDTYHGTEDADLVDALAGDDKLSGEGGDDTLHGGPGADSMSGGDGNDTIYDTDGNDTGFGGAGDDEITLGNPNGADAVLANGGAGRDRIAVSGDAVISGEGGDDSITIGNCRVEGLSGGAGVHDQLLITANVEFEFSFKARDEGVEVVSADHAFTGSKESQRLDFSDTSAIDGFTGGLEMFGQGGDDTLTGTARADTLHGGTGHDRLNGGDGADQLYGDGGADQLNGGDGDDIIHADGGDEANGGAGNDTLYLTGFAHGEGGDGDDAVDCFDLHLTQLTKGDGGTDTLIVETGVIFLSDFDMLLQGFEALDPRSALFGTDGANKLRFDHVSLATGATGAIFYGQGGDDYIRALDGSNDQVHGGNGNDHLFGGSGDDVLWGDEGHNTLDGGDGNDTINGGPNDLVLGGKGNDDIGVTGVAAPGLPPAEVLGGAGDDHIRLSSTTLDVMGATHRPWHAPGGQKGGIDGGAGTDTLEIGGGLVVDADTFLVKKSGFEIFEASAAFDCGSTANLIDVHGVTITGALGGVWTNGEGGDDTLIGSDAQDRLIGGSGNDDIQGGAGQDSLFGSDGNDTLEGGAGDDSLQGEGGTDTLSYVHAAGAIIVSLAISGGQATGGAGTDTATGFENLTGSRHDDQLTGDGNANLIIGGLGADTLAGGGGADTFQFGAHDSVKGKADLITDLTGSDHIDVGGITHAFHLVGSFSGDAGEATLTYDPGADLTTLAIDADGDGKADNLITMTGDQTGFTGFVS